MLGIHLAEKKLNFVQVEDYIVGDFERIAALHLQLENI